MAEVGSLAKHHLLVCVFMNDAAVGSALADAAERRYRLSG